MSREVSDAYDLEELELRRKIIRLIRAYHEAFNRIGERRGPFLIYDDDSPETTIPRAEFDAVSEQLSRAIHDYTLHVNLESRPLLYQGKIYDSISPADRAWTYCLDVDDCTEIDEG